MFKSIGSKCLFLVLICICHAGFAQVKISAIEISGNKKTRAYIVNRELPYKAGDIVSKDSLPILNTIAQQQLFNTALFLETNVIAEPIDSNSVKINIQLKERWYFFLYLILDGWIGILVNGGTNNTEV